VLCAPPSSACAAFRGFQESAPGRLRPSSPLRRRSHLVLTSSSVSSLSPPRGVQLPRAVQAALLPLTRGSRQPFLLALALGRVNIGLASLHRPLCLQAERGCSKICHTSALSSQFSLQRLAPRLVSTRHALAQPVMASTASSFGKASSVKNKRYPGLPLLTPSVMVPRSAAAVRLPLQPATSTSLRQIAPRPRRALRQSRGASAGSGLRLCVKDDLLQVGVLLDTQGATDERLTASSKTVVAYFSAINAVHNDFGYPS
jgi:hypothetical protein